MTEAEVLRSIRSRKGRPFSQQVWEDDWHRLDDTGRVLNVRTTEPLSVPGGVRLTIDLVERASIGKLTIRGVSDEVAAALLKAIKSCAQGVYDKGQIHLDRLTMEQTLHERGYANARADYVVEIIHSHSQRIGGKWRSRSKMWFNVMRFDTFPE